jgi:hypothetical protein
LQTLSNSLQAKETLAAPAPKRPRKSVSFSGNDTIHVFEDVLDVAAVAHPLESVLDDSKIDPYVQDAISAGVLIDLFSDKTNLMDPRPRKAKFEKKKLNRKPSESAVTALPPTYVHAAAAVDSKTSAQAHHSQLVEPAKQELEEEDEQEASPVQQRLVDNLPHFSPVSGPVNGELVKYILHEWEKGSLWDDEVLMTQGSEDELRSGFDEDATMQQVIMSPQPTVLSAGLTPDRALLSCMLGSTLFFRFVLIFRLLHAHLQA